jgi:uncharacterized protein with GYD domain
VTEDRGTVAGDRHLRVTPVTSDRKIPDHRGWRTAMPTYITLASFTDQGVRNAKDSPKRAEAFKEMAKKHGVTVRDVYWTQGRYDVVTITEAPDDMASTALSLSIAGLGNVRTETLRAFSAADMQTIIGKMA